MAEREREREQEHQQHMAGEAQRAKQWEQVCFSVSISNARFNFFFFFVASTTTIEKNVG